VKARPLIKTSVLRSLCSRRVHLFKNDCIPSNVQDAWSRTVTLLRSYHEGYKQHLMLSDRLPAQFQVWKRSPSWISFVLSDFHRYRDHRRQICVAGCRVSFFMFRAEKKDTFLKVKCLKSIFYIFWGYCNIGMHCEGTSFDKNVRITFAMFASCSFV
jgi:hypothetical protein